MTAIDRKKRVGRYNWGWGEREIPSGYIGWCHFCRRPVRVGSGWQLVDKNGSKLKHADGKCNGLSDGRESIL